jgi:hypothetical protein
VTTPGPWGPKTTPGYYKHGGVVAFGLGDGVDTILGDLTGEGADFRWNTGLDAVWFEGLTRADITLETVETSRSYVGPIMTYIEYFTPPEGMTYADWPFEHNWVNIGDSYSVTTQTWARINGTADRILVGHGVGEYADWNGNADRLSDFAGRPYVDGIISQSTHALRLLFGPEEAPAPTPGYDLFFV